MYLSSRDWCYIRGAMLMTMPDVVTISTVTATQDDYGTRTEVHTPVITVSGQLSNPTGNEQRVISALVAAGVIKTQAFTLTLPYGTAITTEHVVTIDGTDFNVAHVNTPMTFTAATVAIIARRDVTPLQDTN